MKQFRSDKGLTIEAYDRSGKIKLAEGQLQAVDNQIDTSTGTIKLKGQFANEDDALFANQFVNIRMLMDTLPSVTIIPTAAIQRGIIGTFVYVVKADQTVSVRPLTLGPTEVERVAVLDGLQPDERVVVDGADKLREGMKVKLVTREPAPHP
jgi:multidrug efflux system membrane fusion protein